MEDKAEKPGYAALRRCRESKLGADYFLTTNLSKRGSGLEAPGLANLILQQSKIIEADLFWSIRTAVVMPDHVHLLVHLLGEGSLPDSMRLFKGRLAPALRREGLKWQEGYFEHRLRDSEAALPVFLYVYLNPYRAGLISSDQPWPGYYCAPADWKWFGEKTGEALPQLDWLR